MGQVWRGAVRLGETAGALAGTGLEWLLGDRPPAPALLRKTFERLGATYIKLGQFIASSPSLFPPEYVNEFQKCLDQTAPIPFRVVERTIQAELGRPLADCFASIEQEPLASASIAQVHAARLHNGLDVVLKVQKPGVSDVLSADLNFLYIAAAILERLAPAFARTSLSGIIQDVQETMLQECDFLLEARNIELFRDFLEQAAIDSAAAPRVYHEFTTSRLLTMERFFGSALTDLESLRRVSPNPEATLISALNTWFASLTMCQFFHADVHAGNLLALEDGRVGFIDFGIVGHIRRETWLAMNDLMQAMSAEDYRAMAAALSAIGAADEKVDVDRFGADLKEMFSGLNRMAEAALASGMRMAPDEGELNRTLIQMVEIGERHGIRFPREFALLFKQILYFDRYIRLLAPEMDLFADPRLERLPQSPG
ncbi:MAG: AarF/ABC1/UbiB kinase family protein [Leptospirales bacterium]|nr:AarF/ABC1/UbiB kinase family protein [Leptospirales bacterium]